MDLHLRDRFISLWTRYFDGAELPITFYYTDDPGSGKLVSPPKGHRCVIADLQNVRRGKTLAFNLESVGCFGGKRYFGFSRELSPSFEYFLSCGIPGKLEGERYKKTPALVREFMKKQVYAEAPEKYIVFSRWDQLTEVQDPAVAIFFSPPDVLSGIFTLAGFDESDLNAVVSPFGSGCMSIVMFPFLENKKSSPRCVLGMFDVSARPFITENELTLAVPMKKMKSMIENMEESFLITGSWKKVQRRISRRDRKKE